MSNSLQPLRYTYNRHLAGAHLRRMPTHHSITATVCIHSKSRGPIASYSIHCDAAALMTISRQLGSFAAARPLAIPCSCTRAPCPVYPAV